MNRWKTTLQREDDLDRKRPGLPDPGTWAALIRLRARSPQVGLGDGWRTRFRASRPSPNIHVTRGHFGTRPSWVLNLCGDWLGHVGAHVSTTQAYKIASAPGSIVRHAPAPPHAIAPLDRAPLAAAGHDTTSPEVPERT